MDFACSSWNRSDLRVAQVDSSRLYVSMTSSKWYFVESFKTVMDRADYMPNLWLRDELLNWLDIENGIIAKNGLRMA